jgi:4-hydroxythreonine-4-phosphate dehydrogenase
MQHKIIGITIGDPSGIGPEIVIKALTTHAEIYMAAVPLVFGHGRILKSTTEQLGIAVEIIEINHPEEIGLPQPGRIFCHSASNLEDIPEAGKINAQAGQLSFDYIRCAAELALDGRICAIATAPINKEAMRLAGVPYLDHTAILTKLCDSPSAMTLFVTGELRIFFYSRHIPLSRVAAALNEEALVESMRLCLSYLKRLGIGKPRLALAALNPHGGENGMFGDEEIRVLQPAVIKARSLSLNVTGPIAADSVFHLCREGQFDAVLSLYHDQGHIAAKTLDFYGTVSLTMGLPFLRTSVDHGTAMDLAGQNRANERSMVEAILAAAKYSW